MRRRRFKISDDLQWLLIAILLAIPAGILAAKICIAASG
jgi:hypothetical protein